MFYAIVCRWGINSVDKIRRLLLAGADKISITTAAHTYPDLINQAANLYGRQCIVVGLDVKLEEGNYVLYSHCGTQKHKEPYATLSWK